jgi:hypothetical protein
MIFMKQGTYGSRKKYKVVTKWETREVQVTECVVAKEIYQAGLIGDVHTAYAWTNRPVWPQGIPTPTGKFDVPSELNWDLWLGTGKLH